MINRLIRGHKLLVCLLPTCGISLFTGQASAAYECYFENANTVTISSVATQGTVMLKPGGGWLTQPLDSGQHRTTACNVGQAGQHLFSWKGAIAPVTSLDTTGTLNGNGTAPEYQTALFKTNVTGIFYAVELIKTNSTQPAGYIADASSATAVARIGDDVDVETLGNSTAHNFYIRLYQSPDYISNSPSVSAITPAETGEVGRFRYSSGHNVIQVVVSNFSIPIQLPGCNAALSSQNASGSTVNMGTVTPDDIRNGTTKPVPFGIALTGCANASQAVVKFTADQFDSTTGYLKNTASDMGVGVKITRADTDEQLKPGGSASNWTLSGSSATMSMNAQLMKLGDTVSPGEFSAQGTFEITYN